MKISSLSIVLLVALVMLLQYAATLVAAQAAVYTYTIYTGMPFQHLKGKILPDRPLLVLGNSTQPVIISDCVFRDVTVTLELGAGASLEFRNVNTTFAGMSITGPSFAQGTTILIHHCNLTSRSNVSAIAIAPPAGFLPTEEPQNYGLQSITLHNNHFNDVGDNVRDTSAFSAINIVVPTRRRDFEDATTCDALVALEEQSENINVLQDIASDTAILQRVTLSSFALVITNNTFALSGVFRRAIECISIEESKGGAQKAPPIPSSPRPCTSIQIVGNIITIRIQRSTSVVSVGVGTRLTVAPVLARVRNNTFDFLGDSSNSENGALPPDPVNGKTLYVAAVAVLQSYGAATGPILFFDLSHMVVNMRPLALPESLKQTWMQWMLKGNGGAPSTEQIIALYNQYMPAPMAFNFLYVARDQPIATAVEQLSSQSLFNGTLRFDCSSNTIFSLGITSVWVYFDGSSFPGGAPQTTWTGIRDFLFTNNTGVFVSRSDYAHVVYQLRPLHGRRHLFANNHISCFSTHSTSMLYLSDFGNLSADDAFTVSDNTFLVQVLTNLSADMSSFWPSLVFTYSLSDARLNTYSGKFYRIERNVVTFHGTFHGYPTLVRFVGQADYTLLRLRSPGSAFVFRDNILYMFGASPSRNYKYSVVYSMLLLNLQLEASSLLIHDNGFIGVNLTPDSWWKLQTISLAIAVDCTGLTVSHLVSICNNTLSIDNGVGFGDISAIFSIRFGGNKMLEQHVIDLFDVSGNTVVVRNPTALAVNVVLFDAGDVDEIPVTRSMQICRNSVTSYSVRQASSTFFAAVGLSVFQAAVHGNLQYNATRLINVSLNTVSQFGKLREEVALVAWKQFAGAVVLIDNNTVVDDSEYAVAGNTSPANIIRFLYLIALPTVARISVTRNTVLVNESMMVQLVCFDKISFVSSEPPATITDTLLIGENAILGLAQQDRVLFDVFSPAVVIVQQLVLIRGNRINGTTSLISSSASYGASVGRLQLQVFNQLIVEDNLFVGGVARLCQLSVTLPQTHDDSIVPTCIVRSNTVLVSTVPPPSTAPPPLRIYAQPYVAFALVQLLASSFLARDARINIYNNTALFRAYDSDNHSPRFGGMFFDHISLLYLFSVARFHHTAQLRVFNNTMSMPLAGSRGIAGGVVVRRAEVALFDLVATDSACQISVYQLSSASIQQDAIVIVVENNTASNVNLVCNATVFRGAPYSAAHATSNYFTNGASLLVRRNSVFVTLVDVTSSLQPTDDIFSVSPRSPPLVTVAEFGGVHSRILLLTQRTLPIVAVDLNTILIVADLRGGVSPQKQPLLPVYVTAWCADCTARAPASYYLVPQWFAPCAYDIYGGAPHVCFFSLTGNTVGSLFAQQQQQQQEISLMTPSLARNFSFSAQLKVILAGNTLIVSPSASFAAVGQQRTLLDSRLNTSIVVLSSNSNEQQQQYGCNRALFTADNHVRTIPRQWLRHVFQYSQMESSDGTAGCDSGTMSIVATESLAATASATQSMSDVVTATRTSDFTSSASMSVSTEATATRTTSQETRSLPDTRSQEITATQLATHTATAATATMSDSHRVPKPPYRPSVPIIPASIASSLAIVAGVPAAAVFMQNMKMLSAIGSCGDEQDIAYNVPPLSFDANPTAMSIGESHVAEYRGAIVGNSLIITACLVALNIAAFFITRSNPKKYPSLDSALVKVRYPGLVIIPLLVLVGPTAGAIATTAAAAVDAASGTGNPKAKFSFALVSALLYGAVMFVIGPLVVLGWVAHVCATSDTEKLEKVKKRKKRTKDDHGENPIVTLWHYLTHPWRAWKETPFSERFGDAFEPYERVWFVVLDFAVPISLGMIGGSALQLRSQTSCFVAAVAALVICSFHLVALMIVRPFMNRLDTMVGFTSSSFELLGAAMALLQVLGQEVPFSSVGLVTVCVALIGAAAAVLPKFFRVFRSALRVVRRIRAARKQREKQKKDEKRNKRRLHVSLQDVVRESSSSSNRNSSRTNRHEDSDDGEEMLVRRHSSNSNSPRGSGSKRTTTATTNLAAAQQNRFRSVNDDDDSEVDLLRRSDLQHRRKK